jgi:hypothetical protein
MKATITYNVEINQIIEVSEDDNRISLHKKALDLGVIDPNIKGSIGELYISDINTEGNPLCWVCP